MPAPGDSALLARARVLLAAMTERARWIYAVPRRDLDIHAMLTAEGLLCEAEDKAAGVARFATKRAGASFVVFDSPDLGVLLIEAEGSGAPPILARVLNATGFLSQSELLRAALDVSDERSSKALRVLAHMVVAWDDDWSDLLLLHLASPDPIARHVATAATCVAAMIARDAGPTKELLGEALRREKFPKLRETMAEALRLVEAMTGGPVELSKG
jgi:hypothetical protein